MKFVNSVVLCVVGVFSSLAGKLEGLPGFGAGAYPQYFLPLPSYYLPLPLNFNHVSRNVFPDPAFFPNWNPFPNTNQNQTTFDNNANLMRLSNPHFRNNNYVQIQPLQKQQTNELKPRQKLPGRSSNMKGQKQVTMKNNQNRSKENSRRAPAKSRPLKKSNNRTMTKPMKINGKVRTQNQTRNSGRQQKNQNRQEIPIPTQLFSPDQFPQWKPLPLSYGFDLVPNDVGQVTSTEPGFTQGDQAGQSEGQTEDDYAEQGNFEASPETRTQDNDDDLTTTTTTLESQPQTTTPMTYTSSAASTNATSSSTRLPTKIDIGSIYFTTTTDANTKKENAFAFPFTEGPDDLMRSSIQEIDDSVTRFRKIVSQIREITRNGLRVKRQ